MPKFVEPMLAELTENYFDDKDWIFEKKLDGERVLAYKSGGNVQLKSRNGNLVNISYPEIVAELEKIDSDFVIDGEVTSLTGSISDFSKLQSRMHVATKEKALQTGVKIHYYVFDVLYFEGYLTEKMPLEQRKMILKDGLTFSKLVKYLPHINGKGIAYRSRACQKGWEGVIAKDKTAPYVHKRSSRWLKFKCSNEQELVVGGYTCPKGSRIGLGALLLGFYEKGKFKYAGKVGTGFTGDELKDLKYRLSKLEVKKSPFEISAPKDKSARFVKPRLVAEIAFTQWTKDDRLRHPRFLGLRRDKDAKKVIKEEPK